jgi:uncharacterized protein YkwD
LVFHVFNADRAIDQRQGPPESDGRAALLSECYTPRSRISEGCLTTSTGVEFNRVESLYSGMPAYQGGGGYNTYYGNRAMSLGSNGFGTGMFRGIMGGGLGGGGLLGGLLGGALFGGFGRRGFGGGMMLGLLGGRLLGGLIGRFMGRFRGGGCGGGGFAPDNGGEQDNYPDRERNERRRRDEADEDQETDKQRRRVKPDPNARGSEKAEQVVDGVADASSKEKNRAKSMTSFEAETLALINEERSAEGLHALTFDPRVQLVALKQSKYQNANGIGHYQDTPGWESPSARLSQVNLRGWRENAAFGPVTPQSLVRMWMDSPLHRNALMARNTTLAGISHYGDGSTFNTV